VSQLIDKAKGIVYEYAKSRIEKTDDTIFEPDDVYVVWFTKTLQNWKALLSTTLPDGMYYELTANGDKGEIYLDAYKKFDNLVIADPQPLEPVTNSIPVAGEHGRKCKVKPHPHGNECHSTCPSCHGLAKY
jgi:hypothetical protein